MNNFLSGLYIVSTPIGNLEDITLRALNVLKNSDKILCEDTRRSIKLLNHYKISKQLVSNHKFNEKKTASKIVQDIKSGQVVSMISDAGTPTISDPGLVLITECIKNKVKIFLGVNFFLVSLFQAIKLVLLLPIEQIKVDQA